MQRTWPPFRRGRCIFYRVAGTVFCFFPSGIHHQMPLEFIFALVAIASMLFGSLIFIDARTMSNGSWLYSSIAHMGYLLVAFLLRDGRPRDFCRFSLPDRLARDDPRGLRGDDPSVHRQRGSRVEIADYRGLFWHRPWLGATIVPRRFFLFAGVPLTVGFIGKFYLVLAGVRSRFWLLDLDACAFELHQPVLLSPNHRFDLLAARRTRSHAPCFFRERRCRSRNPPVIFLIGLRDLADAGNPGSLKTVVRLF